MTLASLVFAVLALAGDDPWLACKLGASVGGDCDTIAAMAGAVAGACCGVDALPVRANVEHLDLDGLADALRAAGFATVTVRNDAVASTYLAPSPAQVNRALLASGLRPIASFGPGAGSVFR